MELIKCTDVCMRYEGVTAVNNVSFAIDDGDFLCIVGENGSGKSTIMKGILGLKKCHSGKIEYIGVNKNEIGYLPQQSPAQKDFPATVREVVLSGCLNSEKFSPFYSAADRKRASEIMESLHINTPAFRRKCYRNLSGGQQQRVLLARALCSTKKLILLDEPVSGLDPVVTAEMYEIIRKLNKDGVAVIMISHDLGSALKYGNKILHMHSDGYFFGSVSEYKKTDVFGLMNGGAEDV